MWAKQSSQQLARRRAFASLSDAERAKGEQNAPISTCVSRTPKERGMLEAAATTAKARAADDPPLPGGRSRYAGRICVGNVARPKNNATMTTLLRAATTHEGRARKARGAHLRTYE